MELLGFSFILDNDDGLIIRSGFNLEGPKLHILLDDWVSELSSDESLGIEDGVDWVLGGLVLSGFSYKSFFISKGNN